MSNDQLFGEDHFDVGLVTPPKLPVRFRLLVPYMHTTPILPAGTILELATNDSLGYTRGSYAFEYDGILYSVSADDCYIIPAPEWTEQQEHFDDIRDGGMKYDSGKLRASLLRDFPLSFIELAKILTFGANKYKAQSWQTVPNGIERYSDAADRHDLQWWAGEVLDEESGCMHEAQVIINRLFVLELKLRAARAALEGETK